MPKSPTFPDCFDEVRTVTIGQLKRSGFFRIGQTISGTLSWSHDGNTSGTISISVNMSKMFADLAYVRNGKPINYRVQLDCIPAHFGGYNWYFICPETGERCSKLYGIGERFLSRFAYPSAMYSQQKESKRFREVVRAYKCLCLRSDFQRKPYARTMYKGKLTKRFSRILDREERGWNPDAVRRFLGR